MMENEIYSGKNLEFKNMCSEYQEKILDRIDTGADSGIGEPEQSIEKIIEERAFRCEWDYRGFTVVSRGGRFAALWDAGGPCIAWIDEIEENDEIEEIEEAHDYYPEYDDYPVCTGEED